MIICIITIVVDVVIALVAQAVPVGVPLGRVLRHFAVVTRVAVDVLVAVLLVHVGDEPTVVLVQTKALNRLKTRDAP